MLRRPFPPFGLATLFVLAACCGRQQSPTAPAAARSASANTSVTLASLPHVTLVALSDWQGVIKPCGCTIELQRGGIERIARHLKVLRASDPSTVVLHAGSLLTEDELPEAHLRQQRDLRVSAFAEMLERLDVAAVALSSHDLKRGGAAVRRAYDGARWPVLAAGWGGEIGRARPARVFSTASGVKVGITAVDPSSAADPAGRNGVVSAQIAAMRKQGAQIVVVLSNLGMRGSRKLARKVPGIDVIVIGDVPERSETVERLERDGPDERTLLMRTPRHGAWLAELTLARNGDGSWREVSDLQPGAVAELSAKVAAQEAEIDRFRKGGGGVSVGRALPIFEQRLQQTRQRLDRARAAHDKPLPTGRLAAYRSVGLPWSLTPDADMAALVIAHDKTVGDINVKAAAKPLPATKGQASYVGHATCMGCHAPTAGFVAKDPHYRAWATLVDAGKDRDLDCVPCHTTGFRKPGGSAFDNLQTFVNVQCEACHGPGSKHVAAGGEGGVPRVPAASMCEVCHTQEHSPRFEFDAYRQRLRVPGHGKDPAPTSSARQPNPATP